MQTIFRGAEKRTNGRECTHCHKAPEDGKPRFKCSACKDTIYCSTECQRLAWKVHKPLCLTRQRLDYNRKSAVSASLPPLKERTNLLTEFVEIHSWYIQRTICYAMRYLGFEGNFEFKKTYLQISLRYRHNCNKNPSLAFDITDFEFLPVSEVRLGTSKADALEAGRLMRDDSEAKLRETQADFLGLILIAYQMEDYVEWHPQQYYKMSPFIEEGQRVLREQVGENWKAALQRVVSAGLVFRRLDKKDGTYRVGSIRKKGNRWCWERMTADELAVMGLPPDFGFIW